MPAARQPLHHGGVDFYLAPTADDRDIWVAAMRAFAFEAGAFVLSPVQYLRAATTSPTTSRSPTSSRPARTSCWWATA